MINENDCQYRREEITALVLGELDSKVVDELQRHIESCKTCQSLYQALADEEEAIRSVFKAIADKGETLQSGLIEQLDKKEPVTSQADTSPAKTIKISWGKTVKSPLTKIAVAAGFLIISSWVVSFVLYREVTNLRNELSQRDVASAPIEDSATINFYLREHRGTIAQKASLNSATPQPVQMHIDQDDILYYEFLDNGPEYMNPGIIIRGTSPQREIVLPATPLISNGHTLSLSEARKTAGFNLVSPAWLDSGYRLDQIRRIEDHDALQLLYTDGINSVSLFEQSLDGQRGLSAKDFREYAVYCNKEQAGGTILAWRDVERSYVLIGKTEMSQLMDMAQSISVRK